MRIGPEGQRPERDDKTQHASSRLPPGCYFLDDLDLLILALAVSRPDCGFWLGGGACSASFLGKFVASGGDGQIIWTTSCTFVTLLSVTRLTTPMQAAASLVLTWPVLFTLICMVSVWFITTTPEQIFLLDNWTITGSLVEADDLQ